MNTNTASIEGNLTGAPEVRFTPAGMAVTTITVAHNTRVRDDEGNWVDGKSTFVDVVCWGRLAQYVGKSCEQGTRVLVTGRLSTNKWIDPATGQNRSKLELIAETVALSLTFAPAVSLKGTNAAIEGKPMVRAVVASNGSEITEDEEPF